MADYASERWHGGKASLKYYARGKYHMPKPPKPDFLIYPVFSRMLRDLWKKETTTNVGKGTMSIFLIPNNPIANCLTCRYG